MTIHQDVTIKCRPEKIFKTLTRSDDFSAATGAPAQIESVAGGAFSTFGGQITGRNIELKDNHMLVQAWRVSAWPDGVYSIVRIDLERTGDDTKLTLEHSGYPAGAEEHLEGGWHKMYWEPLTVYCE
jgi:activator of HSP90 ATPase